MTIEDFLSCLQNVKPSRQGWTARCPAHHDRHNSFSISQGTNARILVKCFVGCTFEQILSSLHISPQDLFPQPIELPGKRGKVSPEFTSTLQHSAQIHGCTLSDYAQAKCLPKGFLQGLGLKDVILDRVPAVRIPYFDKYGKEAAVRFRIALNGGNRFRWKTGSVLKLYGQNRLEGASREGYVILVEGESDCQTLWYHGFPAVGLPGATSWKEDRDAPLLKNIPRIYVVIEPDQGGDSVVKCLAGSSIRDRVSLIFLQEAKDPSALHVACPHQFKDCWRQAVEQAIPLTEYQQRLTCEQRDQAWEACEHLATDPNLLDRFCENLAKVGVAVDTRLAKLLYLVITSRLFSRPLSVVVKGPSSAGKSYIVEKVLSFFPPQAYFIRTSMSERALAYSDEPLKHRFLVLIEMAGMSGELASYLLRSLLSEGRIRYETVEATRNGMKPRQIEREGPTGLIVTTTQVKLHPENETRMFSITVNDTPEQTRHILKVLAQDDYEEISLTSWHAFQELLETGSRDVFIPFANVLAELIPPIAVRLRRDFKALLTFIQAHALVHQAGRARDHKGRIVATFEDYRVIRELVEDLVSEGLETSVSSSIQETVKTVAQLNTDDDEGVSLSQLAKALKIDRSAASRRVRSAIDKGYLKNLEDKKGRPARLVTGDPLPEAVEILPTVEALQDKRCSVDVETGTIPLFPLATDQTPKPGANEQLGHSPPCPPTPAPQHEVWVKAIKMKGMRCRSQIPGSCCWDGCGKTTHFEYGGWFYCREHAFEAERQACGITLPAYKTNLPVPKTFQGDYDNPNTSNPAYPPPKE